MCVEGGGTASLTGLQEAVGPSWGPDAQVTKCHHPRAGPRNSEVHWAAQQVSLVTIATATGAGPWPTVNEGMGRRVPCEGEKARKAVPALATGMPCYLCCISVPSP